MSIKYNNKLVAGKYNISTVSNADDTNAGIIKIATDDELLDNLNNKVAVTPYLLNKALSKSAFGELGDIGVAPLGIDESLNLRRYLNGQTISQNQFKGFTTWLKSRVELYPTLSCTNDEFETACTMSAFRQCGKFVIDNENKTIRLPKVVNIQGLQELYGNIGNTVEAGLPNIKGWFDIVNTTAYDTNLYESIGSGGTSGNTGGGTLRLQLNASRSNPIYGNSDTVQPEAIQYPYYIQVATGVNQTIDITREIELNNPFFLGQSQYFNTEPNNISWLKSEGQYNSGKVYVSYYEWLLKIYNGTEIVDGISVKLNTDTYTDYDFVVNQDDMTFRLPIKNGQEIMFATGVKGNGITLGLTNGTTNTGLSAGSYTLSTSVSGYGNNVGSNASIGDITNNKSIGITTDSTKSGIVIDTENITIPDGWNLYYYIGDTIQDVNLINIGRVQENISSLISDNSSLISSLGMPSNRYIDLAVGASDTKYTAPANGWFDFFGIGSSAGAECVISMYISNNGETIYTSPRSVVQYVNGTTTCSGIFPVKKGDIVGMIYDSISFSWSGYSNLGLRFIYAESEVA